MTCRLTKIIARKIDKWIWLRLLLVSLWLVAGGAFAPSQHPSPNQSASSINALSLLTMATYQRIPQVLGVHLTPKQNQLMLYQWVHRRWRSQVVMNALLSEGFVADTIGCTRTSCVAAGILSRLGDTDELVVFRQTSQSRLWTPIWKTGVPSVAVGNRLQVVLQGSEVWILSAGSPSAGSMPKLLWASNTDGEKWSLVASGDLGTTAAPFAMPQGYPTGMIITSSGQALLSLSPRGNSTVSAVFYSIRPLSQRPMVLPVPPTFRPLTESLPGLLPQGGIRLFLIESFRYAQGYLAVATYFRDGTWRVRQLKPLTITPSSVLTGPDTTVLVYPHTLQFFSPGQRVLTLHLSRIFVHPLVAAVMGPQTAVALGRNGTLWMNRGTSWHRFNTSVTYKRT